MLKQSYTAFLLLVSGILHAELAILNVEEMQAVQGQGGAELNWTLSLNHTYANDLKLKNFFDKDDAGNIGYSYSCTNDVQCRFAFSPNNHKEGDNQKWLVFKKIQGTIAIDKFSIAGSTIINKNDDPQTALQITFEDAHPIKLRNVGFENLSVETDGFEDSNGNNITGYLNDSKYENYNAYTIDDGVLKDNKDTPVPAFDNGTETGFMGLNVHGNLHMSGNLKIFGFNCTGNANARC